MNEDQIAAVVSLAPALIGLFSIMCYEVFGDIRGIYLFNKRCRENIREFNKYWHLYYKTELTPEEAKNLIMVLHIDPRIICARIKYA